VALLRAQEGFRRVKGHKELGQLATALEPARPSAEEHLELAIEIGFSCLISSSQPAEIMMF
jgi:hypothetical protein